MKAYERFLISNGFKVVYVEANQPESDCSALLKKLSSEGFDAIHYFDPCDHWLEKKINTSLKKYSLSSSCFQNPLFINDKEELNNYFDQKKRYFQTDFYIHQRKTRTILLDAQTKAPSGGKWTFDTENRAKYPKNKRPPSYAYPVQNSFYKEAADYVLQHFPSNNGVLNEAIRYPVTFEEAEAWLDDFFANRFNEFGTYEDSIVASENLLHHSLLTPMLNVGLLLPMEVIDKAIDFASKNTVPLNSLEGFVRQLLGWREFIRALYLREGTTQRTKNYWGFTRKIPASFYNATTSILPVDNAITKLTTSAYNHHIERLMILSNFMLLCEFDPDEVYRWFMEMYIDAYDWVMVPNVYGMGQFADGGIMTTKPYISGSNYVLKMSDYKKDTQWTDLWDALFWRFMHVHRAFFLKNPRLGMLVKSFDKMDPSKQEQLLTVANQYLTSLDHEYTHS